MKRPRFNLNHLAIVLFFFGIALTVWVTQSRFFKLQADVEALKPGSVSHTQNMIEPSTGEVGASSAVDFDQGSDASTYSVMYFQPNGGDSEVTFFNFNTPPEDQDAFRLSVIYAFEQDKGDDGITIQYSTSGSTSCSDSSSRTWQVLADVSETTPRSKVFADLSGVDPTQVCVRFDRTQNGEFDRVGIDFKDSNFVNIYDIWMETAEANVDISIGTESVKYAVGETLKYHVVVKNSGTGPADTIVSRIPLPSQVEYVRSKATTGLYDEKSGRWSIGTLRAGESAELDIVVRLDEGFVNNRVQITAGIDFVDRINKENEGRANSSYFIISNEPSGIVLDEELGQENDSSEAASGEGNETSTEVVDEVSDIDPQDISDVSGDVCTFECRNAGFYLYIVNPNGTVRQTISDFSRVQTLGDRHFLVSFEDSGTDFDYNDIAFDLDVHDCRNIQVTMTEMNAGWHHEVRAAITYAGVEQQDIQLWADSHVGVNQTLNFDLAEYISECSAP